MQPVLYDGGAGSILSAGETGAWDHEATTPRHSEATMTDPRVQILDKTVCYDGFFRIERYRLRHELFRGGWSPELTRELFERGHAAAVLPYDPVLDAVVLI